MANTMQVGVIPEWTIGDRLRKARELTELDGRAFAAEIGISDTALYNAESGKSRPRELTLRAWALRTGVPIHWLKYGETPPHNGDGVSALRAPRDSNPQPSGWWPEYLPAAA